MSDEEFESILERYDFTESEKTALRRLKGMTCGLPD